MSQVYPYLMLIYGYYSITAEKTITGGIPKSWYDCTLRFQSLKIGLTPERKVDYFFCI